MVYSFSNLLQVLGLEPAWPDTVWTTQQLDLMGRIAINGKKAERGGEKVQGKRAAGKVRNILT